MFDRSRVCCDCFKTKVGTGTSSIEGVFHVGAIHFFVLCEWSAKCCVIFFSLYILDNISSKGCWLVNIVKADITKVLLLGDFGKITALTPPEGYLSVLFCYLCPCTVHVIMIEFTCSPVIFHLRSGYGNLVSENACVLDWNAGFKLAGC